MTRREFEVTDPEVIRDILDSSSYLHLGLVDEGMPYVVPMNYGYTLRRANWCCICTAPPRDISWM